MHHSILIYQIIPTSFLCALINSDDTIAGQFFAAKHCKTQGLTDFHVLVAELDSETYEWSGDWDEVFESTQHIHEDWTSQPFVKRLSTRIASTSVGDIFVEIDSRGNWLQAVRVENMGFSEVKIRE